MRGLSCQRRGKDHLDCFTARKDGRQGDSLWLDNSRLSASSRHHCHLLKVDASETVPLASIRHRGIFQSHRSLGHPSVSVGRVFSCLSCTEATV